MNMCSCTMGYMLWITAMLLANFLTQVSSMDPEVSERFAQLEKKYQELEMKLQQQAALISKMKANETAVAFSAYADVDRSFGRGQVIIYDRIKTNFGSYYDWESSAFTCPIHGVYLFTVSVQTANLGRMEAVIELDGIPTVTAYGENQDATAATAVTITECDVGGRVDVVCGQAYDTCDYERNGEFHAANSFSGVLLYSLEVAKK